MVARSQEDKTKSCVFSRSNKNDFSWYSLSSLCCPIPLYFIMDLLPTNMKTAVSAILFVRTKACNVWTVDTSHTTYESESNKEIFLWNNKNKLLNKFDTNINFPLFVCENMNVLFLDFEVSAIAVVKILYASRFLFVKFAPFCRVVSVRACAWCENFKTWKLHFLLFIVSPHWQSTKWETVFEF